MTYQIAKLVKKCPVCKSGRIYKRARMKYHHVKNPNIDFRTYVCRNCKNEFDVPICEHI